MENYTFNMIDTLAHTSAELRNREVDLYEFSSTNLHTEIESVTGKNSLRTIRSELSLQLDCDDSEGYMLIRLGSAFQWPEVLDIAILACHLSGIPFRVYGREPYWEPLIVKLSAATNRTHGIGENPLHIDLVTKEFPPEYICFVCERPDPKGGGQTKLASFKKAASAIPETSYKLLQRPAFRYWADSGLFGAGTDLDIFPIIPTDARDGIYRYSEKMLSHLVEDSPILIPEEQYNFKEYRRAMEDLRNALHHFSTTLALEKNDILVFNQRRLAHARCALGPRQETLASNTARRILQGYAKAAK